MGGIWRQKKKKNQKNKSKERKKTLGRTKWLRAKREIASATGTASCSLRGFVFLRPDSGSAVEWSILSGKRLITG
jgi:hypothetical protein